MQDSLMSTYEQLRQQLINYKFQGLEAFSKSSFIKVESYGKELRYFRGYKFFSGEILHQKISFFHIWSFENHGPNGNT